MQSKEVLRVLRITRPTLTKYVKNGTIQVITKQNGQYEYNDADVYAFLNKGIERITCAYASKWVEEDNKNIDKQINSIKTFCIARGYTLEKIYSDKKCESTLLESRSDLIEMIDELINGKISRVIIEDSSRLSKTEFELLKHIITQHSCELVVLW